MARGIVTAATTQAEAEQCVAKESDALRVMRSKRLDLSDLGPAWADANLWVVVVEWADPDTPDPLPQQADPEGETEALVRGGLHPGFVLTASDCSP